MATVSLHACPRCRGAISDASDHFGSALHCLCCGWYSDAEIPEVRGASRSRRRSDAWHQPEDTRVRTDVFTVQVNRRALEVRVVWVRDSNWYGRPFGAALEVEGCGRTMHDTRTLAREIARRFLAHTGMPLRFILDAIHADPRPAWAIKSPT